MAKKRKNIRHSWYAMGLEKPYFTTVWISVIISFSLSAYDFVHGFTLGKIIPEISGHWPHMQMITALCFLISIGGIVLNKMNLPWILKKFIPGLFAFFIVFVSLGTLYADLFALVTGQEFFVFSWPVLKDIFDPEIRMALFTGLNFLFIGIILFLLTQNEPDAAHVFNIPSSLISYFFLISYTMSIYSDRFHLLPHSFNTSIAFIGLSSAIFMMYPKTWLLKVFTTGNTAGIIARQMLLPLMIIPVIIGWLSINGERTEIVSSEVGINLVALTYTFCFVTLTWITARTMNKIDQKRKNWEIASIRSQNRLVILSDIAGRLLVSNNPKKIITEVCDQIKDFLNCEVYINYSVDDPAGKNHRNASSKISGQQEKEPEWLDFDLISNNKSIGTLSFGSKNRISFSNDDLSLMKIVADQIAIAITRFNSEKALRESEDRFRTIAESIPIQIVITRISDGTILFTNDAYNETFGFKQGELIGTLSRDRYSNPLEREEIVEVLKNRGTIQNRETKVVKADGTPFWILASTGTITFDGEQADLTALIDIDRHKKAQQELVQLNMTLNALGKSSHVMMHSSNEFQFLQEVCKIITKDCGYLMVWVGYARNDINKSVEPIAYYGFDRDYIHQMNITWDDSAKGRGPTGTAIRTGKPTVCRDMHNDPNFAPWRDEALKRGYASSLVLPLLTENKAFGSISIYAKEPDAFTTGDIDLLANLANDLAFGIINIRLQESEKKAAEKIKESEEKFRLVFDEMVEGFALHEIILDERGEPSDYRFISANPAFEKHTGLKVDEIIGKSVKEIIPSLEDYWIKSYGGVALSGKSIEIENFSADLNKYFRVSVISPKRGFFATIFENITDRVLAEKELRSTKNYLENLINYANAPIIVWNPKTEIQLFNHAFEHLTGYTADEVIGKELEILFPEDSLGDSKAKIKNALTKIEIPILTKNKEIRTVLWNSANIYDHDERTILSTIAQGHDITERIIAENEVRVAKEKLDLALDNANIGIWTWDIRRNILQWDERIAKMFGIQGAGANNNFEELEKYIHEEDVSHFRRAIQKALDLNITFDTIFRTKFDSNEYKYIDAKARVEKDGQGMPVKMTGVCLDITAMKIATEQTLFNLNEDLLRSNKELEQFAYVASHDLQEPLRMVSSFTQLLALRYKDKLDKQAHEFINFAVDGAVRMQTLINDLLQFSRINTRGKELTSIDANTVIQQTLHNLSLKIKEKKANVTFERLPFIYADEGQMMQLFQNLIDNALKFCDKVPAIHISFSEVKDSYIFSVSDNGIGIEPQYFDRIFQIFQRLHIRDNYSGTGIGLAISKRIVERHGGKIWVETKQGEGTIFKFTVRKELKL